MSARWAPDWWIRLLPVLAPRIIKLMGRAVVVRICSDACTMGRGMAAVASFSGQVAEFTVLLKGAAGEVLADTVVETNEIIGSETFAVAAAVLALGGENYFLRGQQRCTWITHFGALRDSGDFSSYRKFLGMSSTAVGIVLERTRFVGGEASR